MNNRTTKTKKLVASIFKQSQVPLTLSQVYDKAKKVIPTIAFSTIYRVALQLKQDKKLISLDFRDRSGRLEWSQRAHHHHITCNSCGDIADVDDKSLNIKLKNIHSKTGFTIEEHIIELKGICPPCQINKI